MISGLKIDIIDNIKKNGISQAENFILAKLVKVDKLLDAPSCLIAR